MAVTSVLQLSLPQPTVPDRQNRTGVKGQAEQDGLAEQDRQNRTGKTGQAVQDGLAEQDRQNRTGGTGQAELDR